MSHNQHSLFKYPLHKFQEKNQLTYKYYPETIVYTLIVRDHPEGAVIFDPRLKPYQKGLDFVEVRLEICGKNQIKNPPDFSGPWDEIGNWWNFKF